MKTMKTLSRRIAALLLVVTVGITALAPAASASSIQLPSLPKDQCVVDAAGVLSDSTTSELETLNAQLSSSCDGAQIGVLTVDYTGSAPPPRTTPLKPSTPGASAVPARTTAYSSCW